MTAPTLTAAAVAPAALTAFLRGVERRGAVLAELLCGDPIRGDEALAVAMRAFRNNAAQTPVADWPRRFWALLLAVPQLREPAPDPHWPSGFSTLARLGSGPRAALLLRLVAGLAGNQAAAVLGIALPTYRLALQRALPHHADGSPDAIGWRALADAAQRQLRQLPAERLAYLARLREAAIQGRKPAWSAPAQWPPRPGTGTRPRWLPPLLWSALAACVVAFAATFMLPPALQRHDDAPRIRRAPLPSADAPASIFDADTALLTHRDFDQILEERDDALVRDLDFYAWYAAESATQAAADGTQPLLLPEATAPRPDTHEPAPEDADVPR